MNYIETKAIPITQPNAERTYTAVEIAAEHDVTDAAVRNGWYKWLLKVAPAELLKEGKSFTELAHTLFSEFATVETKKRNEWVAKTKEKYAREWGNAGIIDCEIMPETVGGTLALLQNNNNYLQQDLAIELTELENFVDQTVEAESNFSDAELQQFKAAGAKRGLQRFRIETQAEVDVVNALRQRRMQGGNNNA